MHSITYALLATLGLASLAASCAAPANKDSPVGIVWAALFPTEPFGALVFYSLNGVASAAVALNNLPKGKGPFTYRIHQKYPFGGCDPRSKDFNPYCGDYSARTAAEKEVGDLSGKHGVISGTSEAELFDDDYMSLNPKNKAFIGEMAIVIEDAQGQRIGCAEIKKIISKLVGDEAKAAAPVLKLDVPQSVKDLLA